MALDLLSCMKSFVAVAERKGFSVAARQLRLSTPVLTKQMQRLEDFIGKKLFDRTTRRVTLTEAGTTYLSYVKNILHEIQNASNAVHNLEREPHGKLLIGLPGVFNSIFFINILHGFLNKYPKMSLQTTDENSPICLFNGSVDLVISEENIKDKKINREYLFTIRRGVFASPTYIKKYGVPKNIEDLKKHNCLIYKRVYRNNEWIFADNKRIVVHGNYSTSSGRNIISAARAGIGLLWCPEIVIHEELKSGELIEIKLEKKPTEVKVFVYYQPVHYDSNIKIMVDYLKQSVAHLKKTIS